MSLGAINSSPLNTMPVNGPGGYSYARPLPQLNVFVHGRRVAILSSPDGFSHRLTYLEGTSPKDFVSLLMPVRQQSWDWPTLHPFFMVSLPEGFLLQALKEQLGPHLGASHLDLLAVVGHNTIGRVQVSAGDLPNPQLAAQNLEGLLHGASSQQVFLQLVSQFAASGVSGVVPKFLTPETAALFRKGTVATERHIVKGSSDHQPFVALNEHLCMQVAQRAGYETAQTRVSDDGQVLVVERFDIDPASGQRLGFEDFCSLLGLPPDRKYESTWERAAGLVRDFVDPARQRRDFEHLGATLLLTYALGNADCHTKNLAFLYSGENDVRVAPIYDMLTILAYDRYADNPPGMFVDGRKSWDGMKAVWRYMQQHLGLEPSAQRAIARRVAEAMVAVAAELMDHIRHTPGFEDVGLRMMWQWNEGLKRLVDRLQQVPDLAAMAQDAGLPPLRPPQRYATTRYGESELMAPRRRARPRRPS